MSAMLAVPAFLHRPPHPDAELLALCARLTEMQAEWQRLWIPTRDDWRLDEPAITEADHAWQHYNDYVWPAIHLSRSNETDPLHPDDKLGRLGDLHPTTAEGIKAKAVALLAIEDAACYGGNCRNDACELLDGFLRDVAGPARFLLGEDAGK